MVYRVQIKRVFSDFTEGTVREADKKFGFGIEVRIESEEPDISVGLDEVVVAPGPKSSNQIVDQLLRNRNQSGG